MQRPFYIPVPVIISVDSTVNGLFLHFTSSRTNGIIPMGKTPDQEQKYHPHPRSTPKSHKVTQNLTTWHFTIRPCTLAQPRSFTSSDVLHSLPSPPSFSLKSQVFQCFRFRPYPRSLSKTHKKSHIPMFCTSVLRSFTP